MSKFEAVLFDLDGVIVDTAKYHYIAWKKLADDLGVYFDEDINERLKGVSRMDSLNIILERSDKEYSNEEKEKMTTAKNDIYVGYIKKLLPEEILPGVVDFLKLVRSSGLKTSIVSVSKNAYMIIENLGLSEYFDTIVGGNDIKKTKPDPEVFLVAAERLGVVPEKCIVLEDAYAGLEGAVAANMKTIGIGSPDILTNAQICRDDMTGITIETLEGLYS